MRAFLIRYLHSFGNFGLSIAGFGGNEYAAIANPAI